MRTLKHIPGLTLTCLVLTALLAAACKSATATALPQGQTVVTFTPVPPTVTVAATGTLAPPPTATPPASDTPIAGPYIVANLGVNVRSGPTGAYPIVGMLKQGDTARLVGRAAGGGWLAIEYEAAPDHIGYVAETLVSVYGDTSQLPILSQFPVLPTRPPTPIVPTASPTLTPLPTIPTTPTLTPRPPTATAGPIRFYADMTTVFWDEPCTYVRWEASGVQGVFVNGVGMAEVNYYYVCPEFPETTYTLSVVKWDGTIVTLTLTIAHAGVPEHFEGEATRCMMTKMADPGAKCTS